ncbi:hypothetical protein MKX03_018947, partial [Papaver bracteatum]
IYLCNANLRDRTSEEHRKLVEGTVKQDKKRRLKIEAAGIDYECPKIMNCNLNSRSWRIKFYNLQPKVRFKSRLKRISLLLASLGVKLGSHCRENNHILIRPSLSSGLFISYTLEIISKQEVLPLNDSY